MTDFDRRLRQAFERIVPAPLEAAADWQDALSRAGEDGAAPGRESSVCRAGARRARRRPPATVQRVLRSGERRQRERSLLRQAPTRQDQGWGTRPIDRRSGAMWPQLLPEALGWGTRPI